MVGKNTNENKRNTETLIETERRGQETTHDIVKT